MKVVLGCIYKCYGLVYIMSLGSLTCEVPQRSSPAQADFLFGRGKFLHQPADGREFPSGDDRPPPHPAIMLTAVV